MGVFLGVNSAYHESAAALVVDGRLVAACEEERLNRIKHAKPATVDGGALWPAAAVRTVLASAGLRAADVDAVGYSFLPRRRLANIGLDDGPVEPGSWGSEAGERRFVAALEAFPKAVEEGLGRATPVTFLPHHLCHAASAYYACPEREAAVLVIDGIAERDTTWIGVGEGGRLRRLGGAAYPDSIGLLWERIARYCGMSEYDAAKVMGMAAHGCPETFRAAFEELLACGPEGSFRLARAVRLRDPALADLEALLGGPARLPGEALAPRFFDVAAALQERTEALLLHIARDLYARTGHAHLAYAGGVALNCVANGRLLAEGPFAGLTVQPAANDAGTALGAAWLLAARAGELERWAPTVLPLLGPEFPEPAVREVLGPYPRVRAVDAAADAAEELARGRLVGWFRGRMELGPRALGARSILADPRHRDTREVLNRKIKHREPFRPFACCILEEALDDWFELPAGRNSAGYLQMLLVFPVRPEKRGLIPALVHADGSCRIQAVRKSAQPVLHRLLTLFAAKTGVPLVLNTSFNDTEPIVCSPEDALETFFATRLDVLYLGDLRVDRPRDRSIPPPPQRFAPVADPAGRRLALVFGNQASDGVCPYYEKGECWHCDIGAGEGGALADADNLARLTWFRAYYQQEWEQLAHLVIYNSGSVLNPKELAPAVLAEVLRFARGLPRLRHVSLDSREGFIRRKWLEPLGAALGREDVRLMPILGLETADEHVRVTLLAKRMSARAVERAFDEVAACAGSFGMAVNLVLGLPGVADPVADAVASARWMHTLAAARGLPLALNLHPYYPSARGRARFPEHPRLAPARTGQILDALAAALPREVELFLGLHDEDHDTEPGRRDRERAGLAARYAALLKERKR